MGRTFHFTITGDKKFTDKESNELHAISKKYNEGQYENVWSCENFWASPYSYYPNWERWYKNSWSRELTKTHEEIWEEIDIRYQELMILSESHALSVKQLLKEKMVLLYNEVSNCVKGFCKVQGNEYNSLLVLQALIEISELMPGKLIELRDEGEFLLCDLRIKNGKCLPVLSSVRESIEYHCFRTLLSKNFEHNVLSALTDKDKLNPMFKQDLYIENTYGDMTEYINIQIRNLLVIQARLEKAGLKEADFYFYNIENRPLNKWFDPYLFTRKVDIEKFINYKRTPGTLMDGFHGEGFGLTDKDSEQSSYEMSAMIMGMLGDGAKGKVQILGEENV